MDNYKNIKNFTLYLNSLKIQEWRRKNQRLTTILKTLAENGVIGSYLTANKIAC
jgi:hypothetical protein